MILVIALTYLCLDFFMQHLILELIHQDLIDIAGR
jgi:hypothetical protein